jgi:hypothetical protein
MSEPTQPATVALSIHCPRCGRAMLLPLTADCDREAAEHLARLLVCDHCAGWHGARERTMVRTAQPEARQCRLPYSDLVNP